MIAQARDARIDMLRGVSILLVLLHHFNIPYSLKDTGLAALLGWPFLHALARNGNYGVTMFFVVSGFLITRNALDRWGGLDRVRPAEFYALRAARILPCLLLALLTVDALALAGMPIFGNRADAVVSLWMVNAAALTAWVNVLIIEHGWINYPLGVLWSLSVEMAFYLLFPLACLTLRRGWALAALAAGLIVAGPLYRLASQGEAGAYLYGYAACFDAIAMGCCAAVLARRGRFAVLGRPAVRAIIGAAMAALYLAWPIGQSNVPGTTAMAFGTALLLLGATAASAAHAWPLRALAACGRLSYEIYLFHLVVLGLIRGWAPPALAAGDARVALLAAYLAASCAAGWLVARLWSEPANAALRLRVRA
ncbi:acyltransferase [Achromobacter sp. Marseille-Q0513]|uniref:acyltransferase family protein n=1 Tax=Achromobacter sp. Marseille-Q0513 TaxID=2829161 RepID=UPI001B94B3CB|nr:acyltransferase [Achromobacter sp. Marseille-Q0513]MBR8657074.1 acyltransferase [Achromobacter sp. Marseille-Q0513]